MGNIPTHLYPLVDADERGKGLLLLDHNNLSLLEPFDLAAVRARYHVLLFHNWWYDRRLDPERHLNYFAHQRDDGAPVDSGTTLTVRDAFELADFVAFTAAAVRDKLTRDSGLDWPRKALFLGAFHLIDGTFWTPDPAVPRIYDFVLSATTFNARKNFGHALATIDRLYQLPGAALRCTGRIAIACARVDDAYFEPTMAFARARNLAVDLVRAPDQQQLRTLYRSARACFHASWSDAAPRVINECLACGTPVVQYDCEWARENHDLPQNPAVHLDAGGDPRALAAWLRTATPELARRHMLDDLDATHRRLDGVLAARFADWRPGRWIPSPHFGKDKIQNDTEEFRRALARLLELRIGSAACR